MSIKVGTFLGLFTFLCTAFRYLPVSKFKHSVTRGSASVEIWTVLTGSSLRSTHSLAWWVPRYSLYWLWVCITFLFIIFLRV